MAHLVGGSLAGAPVTGRGQLAEARQAERLDHRGAEPRVARLAVAAAVSRQRDQIGRSQRDRKAVASLKFAGSLQPISVDFVPWSMDAPTARPVILAFGQRVLRYEPRGRSARGRGRRDAAGAGATGAAGAEAPQDSGGIATVARRRPVIGVAEV